MNDYTPTTEEIREYVETGGEPRPWVELDEAEESREKACGEAFDRWLGAHDAEIRAGLDGESSTEYGIEFPGGITNVSDDIGDVEDMAQWIVEGVLVSREVRMSEWAAFTPDEEAGS